MKISFGFLKSTNTVKLAALTIVPASLLVCTSCSSSKEKGASETGTIMQSPTRVETFERRATVTAVDPLTRNLTLTTPDGMQMIVKAGPEVRNFDQIQVGDQVKATTTQAMAVSLYPRGMAPSEPESATITVAPKGAKPGAVTTQTTQVTARILTIDRPSRSVTLQMPDGSSRTVQAGSDVDLSRVNPGQDVSLRMIESMALQVEKP